MPPGASIPPPAPRARRWPGWWRRRQQRRRGDPPTGADLWEDPRRKRLRVMVPERDRATLAAYLAWSAAHFPLRAPVLNVGSGGFSDLDAALGAVTLLRQDARPCPGVQFLSDAAALPLADGALGGALLISVLEHARRPDALVRELARVLAPDAPLVLSVPCVWPLHRFPDDYWRFMPDGVLALLGDDFTIGDLRGTGRHGNLPRQILGTALRAATPAPGA